MLRYYLSNVAAKGSSPIVISKLILVQFKERNSHEVNYRREKTEQVLTGNDGKIRGYEAKVIINNFV